MTSRDTLFDQLGQDFRQHRLRQLDVALARFLAERDADASTPLLWLATLLSRQLADGHLCLELNALDELADGQAWPPAWRQLLREVDDQRDAVFASTLVADGRLGHPLNAPLVRDGTRLYLRRYWNHECQVASAIRERLTRPQEVPAQLADELARLFPATATGQLPNWPRIACALSARGAFTVITGGPGTGKTTTVVRLLGLLQTLHLQGHARPLRIRLAAPTGKAAARLNASIANQVARLDVDDGVRAAIPTEVVTLHRLLGARPDTRRFRHGRGNPLHVDVLVIDEASMIDLEMMSAVLAALPPSARLILLGDKDQLSSVEAGAVLGDLCLHAEQGRYDASTAAWIAATASDDLGPWVSDAARPLDQHVAMLRHSHRFGSSSGIGQLAAAVNSGDLAQLRRLLNAASTDLAWVASATPSQLAALALDGQDPADQTQAPAGYRDYLRLMHRQRPSADADRPTFDQWASDVLQAFHRFQLLCAMRHGPCGVDELNRLIAVALCARALIDSSHGWYEGRPVMITRNDYSLGLANGDVGICLRMPDAHGSSSLQVAFLVDEAAAAHGTRIRRVPPARLTDVSTVFAMTVHKSQGSEFEHVALVLPDQPGALLTRELLYTGITRARLRLSLVGSAAMIQSAIERRTRRYSGLTERLLGP